MKKKKRNGFTLVEILITITIICTIGTIAGTTIFNTIKNSKEKSIEITKNNILKSARTYIEENKEKITWINKSNISEEQRPSTNEKETFSCISINELINKNLIKKENIKNNNLSQYAIIWKNKDNIITSEEFDDKANKICQDNIKIIEIPTNEEYCIKTTYNGYDQQLVKVPKTPSSFSWDENKVSGKDAGKYKIPAQLTYGNYWSDGTTDDKYIYCPIDKDTPKLALNPTYVEATETLTNATTILISNVKGTIVLKESNPDYYETSIIDGKEIAPGIEKTINIKSLSTRNIEGTITITLIPEDSNNYYISSRIFTIEKPTKNLIPIEKPTCKNAIYDENSHTLIENHEGYSVFPTPTYIKWGTYELTISLNYGYKWTDNTKDNYSLECEITVPNFKVSYDKNHKSATGTMTDSIITYGNIFKPKENEFKNPGHQFSNWNEKSDGTGNSWNYTDEKEYTKLNNTTLYAQWNANTVNITYNTNGGIVTPNTQSDNGSKYYWTTNTSGDISLNNNLHKTQIKFGKSIDTNGLNNYNNQKYLNITNPGYKAKTGEEWICLSGCSTQNKTFDQTKVYNYNDFCDASNGDCTVVLGVNWKPNTVNIIYNVNGGIVAEETTDKDGITKYLWTTTNGNIYQNNTLHKTIIEYGKKLNDAGLNDSNNDKYLKIKKTGYNPLKDAEWICLSGNCTPGKTFNNYTSYSHNDFCDASNGDCTVVLGVNWKPNTVNIIYNVNGGIVTEETTDKDGITKYLWTTTNGNIYRNNTLHKTTIDYGKSLTQGGLNDYNNPKYLNVTRNGYKAQSGAEWICLEGCITFGKTFNHSIPNDNNSTTYSHNDFCDASNGDCTVVLGVNWKPNTVNIIYNVNGGIVTEETTDKDGITKYLWTTTNGNIYRNNTLHKTTIEYGKSLTQGGLNDYNNPKYLNVTRNGYKAQSGAEWICLEGCITSRKTFNHSIPNDNNSTTYSHNDFCDASNGNCTVVLGVNWQQEYTSINGNRYYCTNEYDNTYRLSIFDNITCSGNNCNYTKINGLTSSNINTCNNTYNNTSIKEEDKAYCKMVFTPTWVIEFSKLSPTISNNCITTKYVRTTSGNGLNCRSGASTKTNRITGVSDCAKITVSKTATKYDSNNNWFYSSDAECYLSGKYLYSNQQCSNGSNNNISTQPNPVMCGKCSSNTDCGSNMTCSGTCTGTNGSYSCCVVQKNQNAIAMCN